MSRSSMSMELRLAMDKVIHNACYIIIAICSYHNIIASIFWGQNFRWHISLKQSFHIGELPYWYTYSSTFDNGAISGQKVNSIQVELALIGSNVQTLWLRVTTYWMSCLSKNSGEMDHWQRLYTQQDCVAQIPDWSSWPRALSQVCSLLTVQGQADFHA